MHWDITLGGQENKTEKSLEEKKGLVWMVVRESMSLSMLIRAKYRAFFPWGI